MERRDEFHSSVTARGRTWRFLAKVETHPKLKRVGRKRFTLTD